MTSLAKWIGGSTLVVLMLIGTMIFAGNALEARADGDSAARLSAENVLASEPSAIDLSLDERTDSLPEYVADPVVQEVPAYDADNPFVIKRILPINGPIRYGEWHWDDAGVPDGPLVVTVDLQARVISVFRNGYEIGAAAALLGTDEHPTPVGTFPILTKERHNVSEKYGNAPMPWTLRLTWDGVAIHGGSTVQLGYASHGCIGVPDEFVSRLYAIAKVGDQVIITNGQTATIGTALASN
ncbi:L,D-transpeptidase family protein [Alteraurantiacibacter aestuarii]|uniref:L,D-transpeptidase family protein n=1 Tax=Alteraurantiacibacter aestuarii TaxID=650004 RepID=A0A844ZNB6_9SPHN|nr:L,D-transpeptidase family protein [Alteraurantiacibacter aestuarii]MXO88812.1 L,D-transpeptidase family protein [Alteraurantiacibacter aestuarii]